MPILQQSTEEPKRTCSICGAMLPSSQAINVIIVVGSPGHPGLASFQNEEEWACSKEHYRMLAHRIIDETIYPHLSNLHAEITNQ